MLKSIPIPSPQGLSLSLDGSKVYVGTRTQALYVIDAATQKVSQLRQLRLRTNDESTPPDPKSLKLNFLTGRD